MRESIVSLFKERFSVPMFWELIPESATGDVLGCYGISNQTQEREIDGIGIGLEVCDFDIDLLSPTQSSLDKIRCSLLSLSGRPFHKHRDLFKMLFVRSVTDGGPALGVATDGGEDPHILTLKITLYK